MKEAILNNSVRYFAFVTSVFNPESSETFFNKVEKYIKPFLYPRNIKHYRHLFIKSFENFADEFNLFEEPELALDFFSVAHDKLYEESVIELPLNDRILILLLILDFIHTVLNEKIKETAFLKILAKRLGISSPEFIDIYNYVIKDFSNDNNKNILIFKPRSQNKIDILEGSWVDKHLPDELKISNEFELEYIKDRIYVLYLERLKLFVVKCDKGDKINIEGESLASCKFKILAPGDDLKTQNHVILNYSEIKKRFLQLKELSGISLHIEDIFFQYKKKPKGIRGLSAAENTGQLIGILGNEGTGKSTLLELIAGRVNPDKGKIYINGYDLKTYKYLLKGLIGYVPEDDLLYDELSVFDNLQLTARLFFSRLSNKELDHKVNRLLQKLDLYEVRNVRVGTLFDKNIQPGQRRLLNIALELIREPGILLVDNAVYGLSTGESSKIIKILHDYTFNGNLVITAISHTNTQAFRMFDKLWILDESGYPVYNGNPASAPGYFKGYLNIPEAKDTTEEITPDTILDLINFRLADSSGETGIRKISPAEWHQKYRSVNNYSNNRHDHNKMPLPANFIKPPNLETQFKIFSIRNFKVKFSNTYNLFSSIFAGPFMALLLGLVLKEKTNGVYLFSQNDNIPVFLFISSIIAITLGLLISSKEILREQNIILKEDYLEFSRFSYINSKITFHFFIAFFQTFLFVLTANALLEFRGMFMIYWLILFSSSCFGVMLGLNFSSAHKSLTGLYEITLPLVIATQLILGGGIINYNSLNLNKESGVPILGEFMVSRWAYEGMMVEQFIKNDYEKIFYDADQNISNSEYYSYELIPQLQNFMDRCNDQQSNEDSLNYYLSLIRNGIIHLYADKEIFEFEYLYKLNPANFDKNIASETKDYLTYLYLHFHDKYENSKEAKNNLIKNLSDSLGREEFQRLKNNNYNNKVASLVLNNGDNNHSTWKIFKRKICRISDPIYQIPVSNSGRSVLFVPKKKFRGQIISTSHFNIIIIWLFSFALYLLILIDIPGYVKRILT